MDQSVHGPGGSVVQNAADVDVQVDVENIMRIYGDLSKESDLRPCDCVNLLFGQLVALCTKTLSKKATKKILENWHIAHILPSLRIICATAESHLESYWADFIVGASDEDRSYTRLTEFPYYANYIDLTRMELSAIYAVTPTQPRKIAFIGSGSLPLTSLCLCHALDGKKSSNPSLPSSKLQLNSTVVVNIDHDPHAISQSRVLCAKLGQRAKGMQFLCRKAGIDDFDLQGFDVVYLAALVGMTQEEKEGVLVDVVARMSEGSLVVVRTAHSLRTLLYPEFDATTEAVVACLEICMVVHPYNHVVNSVIVGRVKPRLRNGVGS